VDASVQTPVRRALDQQIKQGAARLPPGEGERIAFEIIDAAKAAGKTVEQHLVAYVKTLDVKAPRQGMKSAFWSHGIPHPDLPSDKVLSSQHLASVWTDMENDRELGSARYLEGTPGGKLLDELHLWDDEVFTHFGKNGQTIARKAWSALSENYAKETDGQAIVFAGELAPWSVAYETELPQLRRKIGAENIHFMYDLSEETLKGLPPESQQLLSEGRVRSHVHFFAPNAENPPPEKYWETGYLDLEHVKSLPTPELQRAAILEVCERVALLDQQQAEAEAEKRAQQDLDLSAEQEVTAPGIEEQQPTAVSLTEQTLTTPAPESALTAMASTHGVYLPGVEVNAKVASQPGKPLEAAPQAVAGMHFLPGVTVKPVAAPAAPAPVEAAPTQAPPAPEQAHGTGMGE
jgi:hypothetical protein